MLLEMPLKQPHRFFHIVRAILFFAAGTKLLGLISDFPGSSSKDLILWFLPSNVLSVIVISLEVWIGAIIVDSNISVTARLRSILYLNSCFLAYRMSKWFHYGSTDCGCFGIPRSGVSPLIKQSLELIGWGALLLMLFGSVFYLNSIKPSPHKQAQ